MQLLGSAMSSEIWTTNKKVSKLINIFSAKIASVQTGKKLSKGSEYIHANTRCYVRAIDGTTSWK